MNADVTRILEQMIQRDPTAAGMLLPLVYDELQKLAAAKLAHEKPEQTLQATALVHEAYLRLVGGARSGKAWDERGHFFAAAAEAMRRILVVSARRKQRVRHGGELSRVELEEELDIDAPECREDLLALDTAGRIGHRGIIACSECAQPLANVRLFVDDVLTLSLKPVTFRGFSDDGRAG